MHVVCLLMEQHLSLSSSFSFINGSTRPSICSGPTELCSLELHEQEAVVRCMQSSRMELRNTEGFGELSCWCQQVTKADYWCFYCCGTETDRKVITSYFGFCKSL